MSIRLQVLRWSLPLVLCACAHRAAPPVHAASATLSGSEAVIELLVRGEYVQLEHMFDEALKADVPASKLANVWTALVHDRGTYLATEQKRSLTDASGTTDYNLLSFENGPAEVIVYWRNGQVAGLLIQRGHLRSHALALGELALRGDAAQLYGEFSPALKSALSLQEFSATLADARSRLGAQPHIESLAVSVRDFDVATLRCRGDAAAFDLELSFKRGSDAVEGVRIVPVKS